MGGRVQTQHEGQEASPLSGMRLTELVEEVQERLASVARGQARVQHLLDAFLSVSTGLDLPSTLRRIVEAATDLVDARYGALGVLRKGGGLAAFIHVGIDDDLAAMMGSLPEGKGVLGGRAGGGGGGGGGGKGASRTRGEPPPGGTPPPGWVPRRTTRR